MAREYLKEGWLKMKKVSSSVFIFGLYLIGLGIFLFLMPGVFKSLLNVPDLPSVWLRFIGELLAFIGAYYVLAAVKQWTSFFVLSIWLRIIVFVSVSWFVIIGELPKIFFLLSLVDLSGAIWTMRGVRSMKKASKVAN